MSKTLWACTGATCTTMFFRTMDGLCPRCGELGSPMFVAIHPPRPGQRLKSAEEKSPRNA
jgi:hypothetical protein